MGFRDDARPDLFLLLFFGARAPGVRPVEHSRNERRLCTPRMENRRRGPSTRPNFPLQQRRRGRQPLRSSCKYIEGRNTYGVLKLDCLLALGLRRKGQATQSSSISGRPFEQRSAGSVRAHSSVSGTRPTGTSWIVRYPLCDIEQHP